MATASTSRSTAAARWKNVGLKASEHIGKILIDPRDSNIVYVAAQGPLWGAGRRPRTLQDHRRRQDLEEGAHISENTGVTDIVLDPSNPDIMHRRQLSAPPTRLHAHRRRPGKRHLPITDGGKTWTKIKARPADRRSGPHRPGDGPDRSGHVYATVEAADKTGGIFRSTDGGVTWEKRNDFDQQAQYYSHVVVDPENKDRIYVMNVLIQVSDDGGKTLLALGERWKHVDNHAIWIDPTIPTTTSSAATAASTRATTAAANWRFTRNLPVTQFYDLAVEQRRAVLQRLRRHAGQLHPRRPGADQERPRHHQRRLVRHRRRRRLPLRVDPKDPNIIYSESQYGGLVRYDRRTGQGVDIQPQPARANRRCAGTGTRP